MYVKYVLDERHVQKSHLEILNELIRTFVLNLNNQLTWKTAKELLSKADV